MIRLSWPTNFFPRHRKFHTCFCTLPLPVLDRRLHFDLQAILQQAMKSLSNEEKTWYRVHWFLQNEFTLIILCCLANFNRSVFSSPFTTNPGSFEKAHETQHSSSHIFHFSDVLYFKCRKIEDLWRNLENLQHHLIRMIQCWLQNTSEQRISVVAQLPVDYWCTWARAKVMASHE